eukprot:2829043-Rhodomonas_salina.1
MVLPLKPLMVLRLRYTVSGTDTAYAATRRGGEAGRRGEGGRERGREGGTGRTSRAFGGACHGHVVPPRLRSYALSGIGLVYADTTTYALSGTDLVYAATMWFARYAAITWYALSGTDVACATLLVYAATVC